MQRRLTVTFLDYCASLLEAFGIVAAAFWPAVATFSFVVNHRLTLRGAFISIAGLVLVIVMSLLRAERVRTILARLECAVLLSASCVGLMAVKGVVEWGVSLDLLGAFALSLIVGFLTWTHVSRVSALIPPDRERQDGILAEFRVERDVPRLEDPQ